MRAKKLSAIAGVHNFGRGPATRPARYRKILPRCFRGPAGRFKRGTNRNGFGVNKFPGKFFADRFDNPRFWCIIRECVKERLASVVSWSVDALSASFLDCIFSAKGLWQRLRWRLTAVGRALPKDGPGEATANRGREGGMRLRFLFVHFRPKESRPVYSTASGRGTRSSSTTCVLPALSETTVRAAHAFPGSR